MRIKLDIGCVDGGFFSYGNEVKSAKDVERFQEFLNKYDHEGSDISLHGDIENPEIIYEFLRDLKEEMRLIGI